MTGVSASDIGTWILSGLSLIVAGLAYWKTVQTDRRDRGAIIVIEEVWAERKNTFTWFTPNPEGSADNPRPAEAELHLVIVANPTIAEGLVLRPENAAERSDKDLMGHNSHKIEFKLENVGRSAATNVRIDCTLSGAYVVALGIPPQGRDFPDNGFTLESIPVGKARHVEIRNLVSIPVTLTFRSIKTQDPGQPVTRAGGESVKFAART